MSDFYSIGKILGKAIHDRLLVGLPLATCIYHHILGLPTTELELAELDPALAKSLAWMRDNPIDGVLFETVN